MYRRAIALPQASALAASGIDRMFKYYIKVFYVMGKALSGELSCTQTDLVILPVPIRS